MTNSLFWGGIGSFFIYIPDPFARIALYMLGLFSEHFVGQQDDLFKVPDHLTDAEAAALPLAGLTAYRAAFVKGQVRKGQNVLITGAGKQSRERQSTDKREKKKHSH